MIFISLDTRQLKLLLLKKTLLGQYEIDFFEKLHEVALLDNGIAQNVDILASAIKDGLTHLSTNQEKEIVLILTQESFHFMKVDVPTDITASAVTAFVHDKARATIPLDLEECHYDYFTRENDKQTQVSFYAIEKERITTFAETLSLLGLKLVGVIPDTLAYFKLFEKTLRMEKRENILYASYEKNAVETYLYDSGGLLQPTKWVHDVDDNQPLHAVLKQKVDEYENTPQKLNRIILSGDQSEHVRQDTFTKEVGVWTNPLKRIVPNFYDEYVKMLVVPPGKVFPLLSYDVCFGAFIFLTENKNFHLLKKGSKIKLNKSSRGSGGPRGKFFLFRREFLVFIIAFLASFGAFVGLTRTDFQFKLPTIAHATPTPTMIPETPTPQPSPTPTVKKDAIKIKILNGSGTRGIAATAKDELKKSGYEEILTGNADNFDYKTTEIQVKKKYTDLSDDVKKSLSDSVTSPKVTSLSDTETSDIIVILGADFK